MRAFVLICSALLSAATPVASAASEAASIRTVDARVSTDGVEVHIGADGTLSWSQLRLTEPPRLVIDFAGTRNAVGEKTIDVADDLLKRIRIAQFQPAPNRVTRVVFDLANSRVDPVITGEGSQLRVAFRGGTVGSRTTAGGPSEQAVSPEWSQAAETPIPEANPRGPRQRHLLYELSYSQGDRVLAALKALGYKTIEFTAGAGESAYTHMYDPTGLASEGLPVVIRLIDSPKTSLMDPDPGAQMGPDDVKALLKAQQGRSQAVPDIGGTYLHQTTSGEPQERLLIVYDADNPEPMERLLSILREDLDVPARQVVISALVLEINTDRVRELGLQFAAGNGRASFQFEQDGQGVQQPFTWIFDKSIARNPFTFSTKLKALIENGDAEILSNPSVLVLDGRQARIQVGQQVPVVNSTSTAAGITSSVEYFPVGIVLNLRPRISEDGSEVTMQVETIVSAVAQSSVSTSSVFFAPTVDNRQVQTFVRVADNTPFIIGGLISSDEKVRNTGIPGLSRIPILRNLFGQNTRSAAKREVVVVLTPHVMPLEERSFSYVIPQDSDRFDSFGRTLFRNAYRIRSTDLYDLSFVHESEVLRNLVRSIEEQAAAEPSLKRAEPYASLLRGDIPGEDILVRRMLWEIVKRNGFGAGIDPKQILIFQPSAADPESTDFEASFLDSKLARMNGSQNAMLISFNARNSGTPDHPFAQPKADISYESIAPEDFESRLIRANQRRADGQPEKWAILLTDRYTGSTSPMDILRNVLVLKRVLSLNSSLPLTIREFQVGRQIIFPSREDIERSVHVVDRDAARLFYECKEYYRAFEQEFNATTKTIMERWKQVQ